MNKRDTNILKTQTIYFLAATLIMIIFNLFLENQKAIIQILVLFITINIMTFTYYKYLRKKISNIEVKTGEIGGETEERYFGQFNNLFLSLSKKLVEQRNYIEEKNNLIKKHNTLNTKLNKLTKIKDSILTISHLIMETKNIDEILNAILNKAVEIIDHADKGSFLVLKNEKSFEFVASIGYNHEKLKLIKIPYNETFFKYHDISDLNSPYMVNDISKFNKANMKKENYQILVEANGVNIKTTMSSAIIINNDIYGILNVDSYKEDAFNDEDLKMIEYFKEQIQLLIKNRILIEEKLYYSQHDGLTGLYSRHFFKNELIKMKEMVNKEQSNFSLVLFDLNDFKKINDKYGHDIGDKGLKVFSEILSSSFRDTDILGRYGGDEFIAGIYNLNNDVIEERLMLMNEELEETPIYIDENNSFILSFSYGIATYPDSASNIDELFNKADQRMYEQKKKFHKESNNCI
ncbi:MAG: diguanylate cyclase [Firmicutes bacterium]|nr:diguanylate cyclase [Bacillota bacterium]